MVVKMVIRACLVDPVGIYGSARQAWARRRHKHFLPERRTPACRERGGELVVGRVRSKRASPTAGQGPRCVGQSISTTIIKLAALRNFLDKHRYL
jgi:hypothetical protein